MICTSSYFQSRGDCPAGAHHYPASPFLAAAGGSTAHQSVQRSLWEGLVGWFGICGLISGLFVCFLLFWGDWSGDRLKQIQNKLAKEFCCHIPSPPTNCGSDQGLAARTTFGSRCCMPASFRPKFKAGKPSVIDWRTLPADTGHPQRRRKEARMRMAAPVARTFVPSLHASLGPL